MRQVQRRQTGATREHLSHVGDVLGVEVRQVKRRQTRATGEHLTHVGDVLGVEVRQVKRRQSGATREHPSHVGDVLRVEVRQVKRRQTRATIEHLPHLGDVLGVEVRQVKRSQTRATIEHGTHGGDVLGIEVLHIERSQTGAFPEHPIHVGDVLGVEIFQPFDLLERTIIVEPPGSGGGTEISERGIKHHASGGTVSNPVCSCPYREGVTYFLFRLLDAPCRTGAGGTQGIIVESEGRLVRALRHIGLAGLRLRTLRSGEQETNQCEEHRTTIT